VVRKKRLHRGDYEARRRARAAGESEAQAFTKAITQDEDRAHSLQGIEVASGPEIEGDAPQIFVPRKPRLGPPAAGCRRSPTTIFARIPSLARSRMAAKAAAYARAYTHPDNWELRQQVKTRI